MPKHEAGSIKALAIRQKAKGLGKLRWYCEACQKQCRDENGFKCHQSSEGHLRAMRLFSENPEKAIENYSYEFESSFIALLSQRYGTKRVEANLVYNLYVSDKFHVHMNSTKWDTLTVFVKYLGKTGQCIVDETEKGWFIQLIDRSPEALKRQAMDQKAKRKLDDEERAQRDLRRRIQKANRQETHDPTAQISPSLFQRDTMKISLPLPGNSTTTTSSAIFGNAHPKETVDQAEESWLRSDIVVKVIAKNTEYYNKKGIVLSLLSPFVARVRMIDSNDELQLDQDDLQTVIPSAGKTVTLLRGPHRGQLAKLLFLNLDSFSVSILILPDQPDEGLQLDGVEYDFVSKTASFTAPS